jgi:hypothetical protein
MAEHQEAREKSTSASRRKMLHALMALATSSRGRLAILAVYTVILAFTFRTLIDQEISGSRSLYSTTGTYFLRGPSLFEYLLVGTLALVAIAMVGASGFYRRWLFWRPEDPEPRWRTVIAAAIAVTMLIELFAGTTAVMTHAGVVGVSDFHQGEPPTLLEHTNFPEPSPYGAVESIYVWNVLDSIPSLKVPQTINWERTSHRFTTTGGGLVLLLFKVMVILPIIGMFVQLFRRPEKPAWEGGHV